MEIGYRAVYRQGYASVSVARRAIVTFAGTYGFSGDELDDIETAVGEALANAAEHGSRDQRWFAVHVNFLCGSLVVEVKDRGDGFDPVKTASEHALPRPLTRGFGITIMRTLMDHVEFGEGGTRIRLFKRRTATLQLPHDATNRPDL